MAAGKMNKTNKINVPTLSSYFVKKEAEQEIKRLNKEVARLNELLRKANKKSNSYKEKFTEKSYQITLLKRRYKDLKIKCEYLEKKANKK